MPKNYKPAMGRGDDGTTGLLTGGRVSKTDVRIKANAVIDELSAWLGLAKTTKGLATEARGGLTAAQKTLFDVAAHIAGLDRAALIKSKTRALDADIRRLAGKTDKIRAFAVSGKSEGEAVLHLARARCRSAEILAWHVKRAGPCAVYLNRLSDYLFLAAVTAR